MKIIEGKSTIYFSGLAQFQEDKLPNLFPFQKINVHDGFMHISYILTPNAHGKRGWGYLIGKVEKIIHHWIHRRGRPMLLKSIIEASPLYWDRLTHILKGVLEKNWKLCFNFLWHGNDGN